MLRTGLCDPPLTVCSTLRGTDRLPLSGAAPPPISWKKASPAMPAAAPKGESPAASLAALLVLLALFLLGRSLPDPPLSFLSPNGDEGDKGAKYSLQELSDGLRPPNEPLATSAPETLSRAPKIADARFAPYIKKPINDFPSCLSACKARNARVLPFESKCSHQSWCPAHYKPEAISEVCTLLCGQFRDNCTQAKFFVVVGDRPWGLGSDMHARLTAFTYALSTSRVMAYDYSKNRSIWTSPEDSRPECAQGHFDCYFEPISNCELPSNWRQQDMLFFTNNRNGPEMSHYKFHAHTLWTEAIDGLTEFSRPRFPPSRYPHLSSASARSILWWKPQLLSLLFRPNVYMLESAILPMAAKTFASHPLAATSLLPKQFISVFIRAGDKGIEVPLHRPSEYWGEVMRLSERFNISDVYVSSDSAVVLNATLVLAAARSPQMRIYYIDYPRLEHGMDMQHLRNFLWSRPAIRPLIDVALTDLFISSHASAWVGTLSSNWCRMQDELRLGHGRYGVPYHSLDGTYVGLKRVFYEGY